MLMLMMLSVVQFLALYPTTSSWAAIALQASILGLRALNQRPARRRDATRAPGDLSHPQSFLQSFWPGIKTELRSRIDIRRRNSDDFLASPANQNKKAMSRRIEITLTE